MCYSSVLHYQTMMWVWPVRRLILCFLLSIVLTVVNAEPKVVKWTRFQPSIYYYVNKEKSTFNDSKETCWSLGAELAFPKKGSHNKFIHKLCKNNHCWVGITDEETESHYKHISGAIIQAAFTDRTDLNQSNRNLNYVIVNKTTATWNISSGLDLHWSICQSSVPNPQERASRSCPDGYSQGGGIGEFCYKLYKTKKTFAEAAAACKDDGSFLAEPRTVVENDDLLTIALNVDPDHQFNESTAWIGAKYNVNTTLEWYTHGDRVVNKSIHGDRVANIEYCKREKQQYSKRCVRYAYPNTLFYATHCWKYADCTSKAYYICQSGNVVTKPPERLSDAYIALIVLLSIVGVALLALAYAWYYGVYCCKDPEPEQTFRTGIRISDGFDIAAQLYGQVNKGSKERKRFLSKLEPLYRFPRGTTTWDNWSEASSSLTWSSDDNEESYRYSMFS